MEPKAPIVMRRILPYSFIPLLIALQTAAAAPHPVSYTHLDVYKRQVLSKRTSPHVTTVHRVDMTKIAKLRDRYRCV